MKITKQTVYHCYNFCEMFAQFGASFGDLYLLHPPANTKSPPRNFFYNIWKNYKIGLEDAG